MHQEASNRENQELNDVTTAEVLEGVQADETVFDILNAHGVTEPS